MKSVADIVRDVALDDVRALTRRMFHLKLALPEKAKEIDVWTSMLMDISDGLAAQIIEAHTPKAPARKKAA